MNDTFLSKLPKEHLFLSSSLDKFRETSKDWFDFLARNDQASRPKPNGIYEEFPYIQFNKVEFFRLMKKVLRKRTKTFIDIGCGAGDKLDIIKQMRPDMIVHGVEHNPAMAIWANTVAPTILGDALELHYGLYDVIYAYWPIADRKLMDKLIDRVLSTMHMKAKFVLVGYQSYIGKHPKHDQIITGLHRDGQFSRLYRQES